jgi:hypothetical protein
MATRKLARAPEYTPIPHELLVNGVYNKPVHMEGWPASYRFQHVHTNGTHHTIRSMKGVYGTNNRLLYTRRNQPTQ